MLKIQNVIINDSICSNRKSLFYTRHQRLRSSILSFATYFNSLWPQAWKEYTSINRFYLNVRFKGKCIISLIQSQFADIKIDRYGSGIVRNEEISRNTLYRKEHSSDGTEHVQIEIKGIAPSCRIIYFEIEYADSEPFEFIDAYYAVQAKQPAAKVKIAIVICTFKREQFVYRNIDILKTFLSENPQLSHVYDVFVVDNGQTLPATIETQHIRLFPNKNTGGTGGFARGIIEAVHSEKKYTHVLLMDDDIEINTEALQRTYALTALVNQQYSDAFISGSMFRSDIRDFQWEARASIKGLMIKIYGQIPFYEFQDLLINEMIATKHTRYDYAAWWYCCIPIKNIGSGQLPFPFFIRGDDIDYSLKYAKKILHLNGICVWHEPFAARRSNVMDIYITIRNFVTISVLHKFSMFLTIYDLINFFAGNIFTYNYKGAYLVYRGLQDAIEKNNIFEENQIDVINRYNIYNETEEEYKVDLSKAFKEKKLGLFMKTLIILTYGGHFLPGFFCRKKNTATAGYRVAIGKCFAYKKVYVYNPQSGKTIIRKIRRMRAIQLGGQFLFLLLKFAILYPWIRKNLRKREAEYRKVTFWKKHLELDS